MRPVNLTLITVLAALYQPFCDRCVLLSLDVPSACVKAFDSSQVVPMPSSETTGSWVQHNEGFRELLQLPVSILRRNKRQPDLISLIVNLPQKINSETKYQRVIMAKKPDWETQV